MLLTFFLNFIIIALAHLCQYNKNKAEIITVSFQGTKTGYAVIEQAVFVSNYSKQQQEQYIF
jgi:hypothetical protein